MNQDTTPFQHIRLKVSGRVQGVGFRPYVYQLASLLGLKGCVCNTPAGVTINVQGELSQVDDFQAKLSAHAPPQALIRSIKTFDLDLVDYAGFEIIESQPLERLTTFTPFRKVENNYQISPDLGMCPFCLAEFNDPNNRRYHDPFINCSDCGPRYTIMHSLPYDRKRSSMSDYNPCPTCDAEYSDPVNHRFHAQGICCPECGPNISFYNAQQIPLAEGEAAVERVAEVLKEGGLVACKSVGGFHILCDASNEKAIAKLRKRKRRAIKPFAVLCPSFDVASELAEISTYEQQLLISGISPIVLLDKKENTPISELVAPDSHRVGLFLAHTPLQHLLFKYFDKPLIATSANLSGEPILYQSEDVFHSLCRPDFQMVDYVLDFDRTIVNPCDDSIVQSVLKDASVVIRMGRGLAPHYGEFTPRNETEDSANKANKKSKGKTKIRENLSILAAGAQQKSSVAFSYSSQWMLSPYIGDLDSLASEQRYEQNFLRLQNLTQTLFKQVVSDRHPGYASSKWAVEFCQRNGWPITKVPHHYAHVLACMAEYNLAEPVLGFSWDGTGLGSDDTIWGGEVFLASEQECFRVDHLRPFKLLGGDLANQQPRRVALALLFDLMPVKTVLELDLPSIKAFSEFEIHQLYKSYQSDINSPLTTSMGRMFDAVASLIGLLQNTDYEGQSGLLIEALYDADVTASYDFENENGIIDFEPMLWQLIEDLQKGRPATEMASQFLNMLVDVIVSISNRLVGFPVLLAGGVFQNKTLLNQISKRFEHRPQPLYFQQHTPMNDGSIALGQLWWAMHNDGEPKA